MLSHKKDGFGKPRGSSDLLPTPVHPEVTHKEAGLAQTEFAEGLAGSSNQLIRLAIVVNYHKTPRHSQAVEV